MHPQISIWTDKDSDTLNLTYPLNSPESLTLINSISDVTILIGQHMYRLCQGNRVVPLSCIVLDRDSVGRFNVLGYRNAPRSWLPHDS